MINKENTREFNRLYNNLKELFRRIHDDKHNYPKDICADWFVNGLDELLQNESFKERLTTEQIGNIIFMGMNITKTDLLDNENKRYLRSLIKGLRDKQITLMA
jgi:hypothetical protein